jgi:hypothetical protein
MTGWRPGVSEHLGFYVYLLVHPRTGAAFYVGKGTGGRCFAHVAEARKTTRDTFDDYEKLRTIRAIEDDGYEVRIDILRHGLTEASAFEVEAAAIDLLGFEDLANRKTGNRAKRVGRMGVADLNARYGAKPVVIDPEHRVLLIRSARMYRLGITDAELYRATRWWWKLGKRREKAEYAMAVYDGVVRAVYRIEGWKQPTAEIIRDDPPAAGRWGFYGHRDREMEERYLHGDVSAYWGSGHRNPITYVNC